jgi:hypothetical protein
MHSLWDSLPTISYYTTEQIVCKERIVVYNDCDFMSIVAGKHYSCGRLLSTYGF